MVSVQINIKNAVKDIEKTRALFQNQKKHKLFRNMANFLLRTHWDETFNKEGARRGHNKWPALDPRYAMYKAKKGRSTKPLILTGHGRGSAEIISETIDTLEWGTQVPYMVYHQEGDGVPKREFLFVTEQDKKELTDFLGQMAQAILDHTIGEDN